MSEQSFRGAVPSSLRPLAAALDRAGIGPLILVGGGFALGLGAVVAIALHGGIAGAAMFLLSRFSIVLARLNPHSSRRILTMRSICGAISMAGIPFAFALADASHAIAASFAMLGLLADSAARQGLGAAQI